MPGRCFISGCPSGRQTGYKYHLFSPPKDPEDFKKWKEAIKKIPDTVFTPHNIRWKDKELTKSSKLCHRHFLGDDIKKSFSMLLANGTMLSVPLLNWRLEPHKVPSIFDNISDPEDEAPPPKVYSAVMDHAYSKPLPDLGVPDVEEYPKVAETNKDTEKEVAIEQIMPSAISSTTSTIKPPGTDQPRFTLVAPTTEQLNPTSKQNLEWFKRASKLQKMYKRWKTRYHRLDKKFKTYVAKRAEARPRRDGVFVLYSNLNPQEKMYANGLARKGNAKTLNSMRYTKTQLLDSLITSGMGKKNYEFMRKNSVQLMPSLRTIQKFKSKIRSQEEGSSTDMVGYIKESLKDLEEDEQFIAKRLDEACLNGAFSLPGQSNVGGSTSTKRKSPKKKAPKKKNDNASTIDTDLASTLLCSI